MNLNIEIGGDYMTVELKLMEMQDFNDFYEVSLKEFADEQVKSGSWSVEEADERGRTYFKKLLPDGLHTEGHKIFNIFNEGDKVGILWLHVFEKDHVLKSFIYDIKINEFDRGKGLGKMTMQALDEYCKEHDIKSIRLHVFGHNQIAYELYKKMGFETTNYYMEKAL